MKNEIKAYIKSLGGSSAYSGNTKTLYINDPLKEDKWKEPIKSAILRKYGFTLPFTLKTN